MNRFAIVTGTSRGIGAAVAAILLERDWDVLGLARCDAAAPLAAHGAYEHARLDLADAAAVEAFFADVPARCSLAERETLRESYLADMVRSFHEMAEQGHADPSEIEEEWFDPIREHPAVVELAAFLEREAAGRR